MESGDTKQRLRLRIGLAILAALALGGCASSPSPTGSTSAGTTSATNPRPLPKPVDVLVRETPPFAWFPQLIEGRVAFLDIPLANWNAYPDGCSLKVIDPSTAPAQAAAVATLKIPDFGNTFFWPCWTLLSLPGLPEANVPASLFWSTAMPDYSSYGAYRYAGLTGLASGGEPRQILSVDSLIVAPFRSGDFLVVPLSSPAYENARLAEPRTDLAPHLLLLSGADRDPIEVDAAAPRVSPEDLRGLSPYVSWSGFYTNEFRGPRASGPVVVPDVFDLRTGERVAIRMPEPAPQGTCTDVELAGRWLAWTVATLAAGDDERRQVLYLADLETGTVTRVFSEHIRSVDAANSFPALTREWLLWVDDASGHLVGRHLPDMEAVDAGPVLEAGQSVQLSAAGDLLLLDIRFPVVPDTAVNLPIGRHPGAIRLPRPVQDSTSVPTLPDVAAHLQMDKLGSPRRMAEWEAARD